MSAPYIVAVGGTIRPDSTTEMAMRYALGIAERSGARVNLICGEQLQLPLYQPDQLQRTDAALTLVRELAAADGIILGSPGYHGSISGLVKNALDYAEDLRANIRPYLSGRAVGCISTGGGWPGAVNTLNALRDIAHALRGWPTPLGVAINSTERAFDDRGECILPRVAQGLEIMAHEVLDFARAFRAIQPHSPAE
jgi:FMN reductase